MWETNKHRKRDTVMLAVFLRRERYVDVLRKGKKRYKINNLANVKLCIGKSNTGLVTS
jgi:hypothetical protein